MTETTLQEKEIDFPAEITFKTIIRNSPHTLDSLKSLMTANEIDANIREQPSKAGKFISYTVTAEFKSNDELNKVCTLVSQVDGFMNLF